MQVSSALFKCDDLCKETRKRCVAFLRDTCLFLVFRSEKEFEQLIHRTEPIILLAAQSKTMEEHNIQPCLRAQHKGTFKRQDFKKSSIKLTIRYQPLYAKCLFPK